MEDIWNEVSMQVGWRELTSCSHEHDEKEEKKKTIEFGAHISIPSVTHDCDGCALDTTLYEAKLSQESSSWLLPCHELVAIHPQIDRRWFEVEVFGK